MKDPLVSDTYREISTETAPESLNREVLRMAAARSNSHKSRLAAWTKPLALAATFALSLAIVVEYSTLPSNSPTLNVTAPDSVSEAFRSEDSNTIGNARDQARLRSGSNRQIGLAPEPGLLEEVIAGQTVRSKVTSDEQVAPLTAAQFCDDKVRETMDDWSACIDELRSSGAANAADIEFEQFIKKFPAD